MIPKTDNSWLKVGRSGVYAPLVLGAAMLALALLVAIGVWMFIYLAGEPSDKHVEGEARIVVERGAGAWQVARDLKASSLINSSRRFVYHLKVRGKTNDLKFGIYDIPRSASMAKIADILTTGQVATAKVTIPEGWTARQIARELANNDIIDSAAFMDAVNSEKLAESLAVEGKTLEGFLFPETYLFPYGMSAEEVVTTMVNTFKAQVGDSWWKEAQEHKHGLQGIVILASIVQGEVMQDEEAPDAAALYHNRLRKGMKLQACPTVQFLLPEPRRLLNKDLEIDSPYNTYKYSGLPPGPINNPGLAALKAALHPSDSPWIYMVAKGDGSHTFSTTLREHNAAKAKFDEVRRQVTREQRSQRNSN